MLRRRAPPFSPDSDLPKTAGQTQVHLYHMRTSSVLIQVPPTIASPLQHQDENAGDSVNMTSCSRYIPPPTLRGASQHLHQSTLSVQAQIGRPKRYLLLFSALWTPSTPSFAVARPTLVNVALRQTNEAITTSDRSTAECGCVFNPTFAIGGTIACHS